SGTVLQGDVVLATVLIFGQVECIDRVHPLDFGRIPLEPGVDLGEDLRRGGHSVTSWLTFLVFPAQRRVYPVEALGRSRARVHSKHVVLGRLAGGRAAARSAGGALPGLLRDIPGAG